MKQNIYKCRIEQSDSGYVKVTSFGNRQIHSGLFCEINKKVHEAARQYNGELNWMKQYVFFEHGGIKYRQVDATKGCCDGCCFSNILYDTPQCSHPYYTTKPHCTGKIYVVE